MSEDQNPQKGTIVTEPKTHTLDAPGAVLHYDVRSNDASTQPVLLLIGSPMGAEGFVTQAGHFTDRTVVTYDPRGAGRSKRTDGASETTVEEQADDLHRLIDALGAGAVDIFASSGGAVNALALVARHPEQVRILVAHEPPAAQELPDREQALAACEGIKETYLREGFGPAMAKFIALVSYQGPIPAGFADQPGPDPATFGLPTVDDGSRDDARPLPEHAFMPWLPARLRCAPGGIDPHRHGRRSAVRPGHGRPGGRSGGRTARNGARHLSRLHDGAGPNWRVYADPAWQALLSGVDLITRVRLNDHDKWV